MTFIIILVIFPVPFILRHFLSLSFSWSQLRSKVKQYRLSSPPSPPHLGLSFAYFFVRSQDFSPFFSRRLLITSSYAHPRYNKRTLDSRFLLCFANMFTISPRWGSNSRSSSRSIRRYHSSRPPGRSVYALVPDIGVLSA